MENLRIYNKVKDVPEWARKQIVAGRLKGMTDINPQWRILVLTENFGICGIGWKYAIKRVWNEKAENEILSFAEIELYIKDNEVWSDPIPGIGGSKMITKESAGLHVSDECFKMAVTDALSVACKMLGIGASVYSGSKYDTYQKQENEKDLTQKAIKVAIDEIGGCKTLDEVKIVWTKFAALQKNPEFMKEKERMKIKLTVK